MVMKCWMYSAVFGAASDQDWHHTQSDGESDRGGPVCHLLSGTHVRSLCLLSLGRLLTLQIWTVEWFRLSERPHWVPARRCPAGAVLQGPVPQQGGPAYRGESRHEQLLHGCEQLVCDSRAQHPACGRAPCVYQHSRRVLSCVSVWIRHASCSSLCLYIAWFVGMQHGFDLCTCSITLCSPLG